MQYTEAKEGKICRPLPRFLLVDVGKVLVMLEEPLQREKAVCPDSSSCPQRATVAFRPDKQIGCQQALK